MADDGRSRAGLPRKTLKIAVPTVAALGAGAAFAVAAIPDSNGVIHGCVERTATGPNGFPGSKKNMPTTVKAPWTNYAMCAVNPSRIGKCFNDAALCEVIDSISRQTNLLLEIVNYNVEVCTG